MKRVHPSSTQQPDRRNGESYRAIISSRSVAADLAASLSLARLWYGRRPKSAQGIIAPSYPTPATRRCCCVLRLSDQSPRQARYKVFEDYMTLTSRCCIAKRRPKSLVTAKLPSKAF